MNTTPTRIASAIASILACSLLAACGGGGGGGMVRGSQPPTTPAPASPQPAPTPASSCPARPTSDCVVTQPGNLGNVHWSETVTSQYALIKQGAHYIDIAGGNYVFAGGSRINEGGIVIRDKITFQSDMDIQPGAWLNVEGTLVGNVKTHAGGQLQVFGTLRGDVVNDGVTGVSMRNPQYTAASPMNRIDGDFRQSDSGTLAFSVPYLDYFTPLTVTGRADLDGAVSLTRYTDWDLGPYPLPTSAMTLHLIRANGGVFGTFDQWTSPGLFIEGSLRYGSHDVWFDLTRISVQAAASANGIGSPLTLASAGNLDHALAAADGFAGNPTLAQQRFLTSAGRLLWMRDPLQAQRALDSLSGMSQAKALDAALHDVGMSPALSAHLDRRARTHAAGAWSQSGVAGMQSGFDQWLGSHLLAGVHAAHADAAQADAMLDASTQRDERRAGAYLRWFGTDGWYAGADAGYAQRTMLLDRVIDFSDAGRWNAHSRRTLDVANLGGEAGRRLPFAGGSLTPFLRADASAVHGADAIEQGGSGFELALAPVIQHSLATSTGLRYARDWRFANGGWLQLRAGGGAQQTLRQGGDAQRAAFTGAPGAWFDLPGWSPRRSAWFDLGLHGGFGHDWRWAMQGMRSNGNEAWQLRLAREF